MRSLLLNAVLLGFTLPGFADQSAGAAESSSNGTYILEVQSNLQCAQLDIELRESESSQTHLLPYGTGAFGAVALPAGAYAFGDVSCKKAGDPERTFETLQSNLAPMEIAAGQAYFGGRLVIQESQTSAATTPDIIANCVRGTGRFRQESDDQCRDGVGIDGAATGETLVNFYTPTLEASELNQVRAALGADETTLIYQPLTTVSD